MIIESSYPGGNIVVDGVEGDVARLRQDLRTTTEWWFYWNFRVRGAAGRTVTFQFTKGDVFGAGGPCFSANGRSWRWLGREIVKNDSFSFAFPAGMDGGQFAFCIPYVRSNLEEFLAARPAVGRSVLTTSEKGRLVECLTLSSRTGEFVVPLLARSHACESMANYELEGVIDFWLSDQEEGEFLRRRVDLRVVPFVDADGVEDGDQGKCRAPFDHNRDFSGAPIYASVQAIQRELAAWRGRMALALDLHCPWIRDGRNEQIFMVGQPDPWQRSATRLGEIIERTQRGELAYSRSNDIPWGEDWNSGDAPTSTRYIRGAFPVDFAATLEFPYALAGGKTVTAANAHAFGADLARAIAVYLHGKS